MRRNASFELRCARRQQSAASADASACKAARRTHYSALGKQTLVGNRQVYRSPFRTVHIRPFGGLTCKCTSASTDASALEALEDDSKALLASSIRAANPNARGCYALSYSLRMKIVARPSHESAGDGKRELQRSWQTWRQKGSKLQSCIQIGRMHLRAVGVHTPPRCESC
eukprot:scaffold122179_cov27-Tisochrysis_lutea.AAC.1